MSIWSTVEGWAQDAWHAFAGGVADVAGALEKSWRYATSIHDLYADIISKTMGPLIGDFVRAGEWYLDLFTDMEEAFRRVPHWVDSTRIGPLRTFLLFVIDDVYARLHAFDLYLQQQIWIRYVQAVTLARREVNAEAAARARAVAAEHAAMLAQIKALHQAIEKEAASGYAVGLPGRLSLVNKIIDQVVTRNPALKGLEADLVKAVLDILAVDDPLARLALSAAIKEFVNKLGVDRVTGDLLTRLIGPLTGQAHPAGVHDVVKDIGDRITALEDQWQEFYARGGADLQQEGDELKAVTSLVTDGLLLGFFGLAVADPGAWATGVADSLGVVTGDTINAVAALIKRA